MARRFFWLLVSSAGISLLIASTGRLSGPLTVLLLCGACAAAGAGTWLLAPLPWLARRQRWRVRYHAPAPTAEDGLRLGQALVALAGQYGWVDLVWRRHAGELLLELEGAPTAAELLGGLIAQVLPAGLLEPLAVPSPSVARPPGVAGQRSWRGEARPPC